MSILNGLQAACLVLDKRIDNWESIRIAFETRGVTINPFIAGDGTQELNYNHIDFQETPPIYPTTNMYPSWVSKPNAFNAWMCHRKILEHAYVNNLEKIMILEDDIMIEDDFDEIMLKVDEYFSDEDTRFDILQFGGYHHNNTMRITDNILRTLSSGGWHGVIIDKRIIPLLLSFNPIGPYDWICEQFIQPKYDCYCIHPSIVSQKDGYSFVEGGDLSKPSRYSLGE